MTDPTFVPGLELCGAFYREEVLPILRSEFPALVHSAGILGTGSEVAGFDDATSTDHHWGPRVMLFLSEVDLRREGERLHEMLAQELPTTFMGYSTNFGPPDAGGGGRLLIPVEGPPIAHRVEMASVSGYFTSMLGFDPTAGIADEDWLFVPSQRLHELTAGAVFHDGLETLEAARAALRWYPRDVWLYLIGHQWQRIAEEEPFVGRCAENGDELGSRVVAGRLVRDVMRLCFLLERRYATYSKWLGSAFSRLECAGVAGPMLESAMAAQDFAAREEALCAAYETVAGMHNALGIAAAVDPAVRLFYGRPFRVLGAERFAEAAFETMDAGVRAKLEPVLGSIDQWGDSTWLLSRPSQWRRLRSAYFGES